MAFLSLEYARRLFAAKVFGQAILLCNEPDQAFRLMRVQLIAEKGQWYLCAYWIYGYGMATYWACHFGFLVNWAEVIYFFYNLQKSLGNPQSQFLWHTSTSQGSGEWLHTSILLKYGWLKSFDNLFCSCNAWVAWAQTVIQESGDSFFQVGKIFLGNLLQKRKFSVKHSNHLLKESCLRATCFYICMLSKQSAAQRIIFMYYSLLFRSQSIFRLCNNIQQNSIYF